MWVCALRLVMINSFIVLAGEDGFAVVDDIKFCDSCFPLGPLPIGRKQSLGRALLPQDGNHASDGAHLLFDLLFGVGRTRLPNFFNGTSLMLAIENVGYASGQTAFSYRP